MVRAVSAGLSPDEKTNAVARGAGAGAATGAVASAVGALITGRGSEGVLRAGSEGLPWEVRPARCRALSAMTGPAVPTATLCSAAWAKRVLM